MSKQGNMETSNICATEDVFEQFVQDFESGEFITLSELVPSSYAGNEVMDTIIMEMPNGQTEDQNVKDNITFATVDQQVNVQEINPTSASGHTVAHNVMDNITFAADDQQENVQEINPTLSSDHTFAHNVMDNVTLAIEDQQVSVQTTSSDLPRKTYVVYSGNQSHTKSTPKVGNKRGRKKKSVTALQNNAEPVDNSDLNFDMIIGEDDFPDPTAPTTPRKAVKSLKTVVGKTSTPNVTHKPISPKKTRGRPKKQISESSPNITTTSIIEPKKRNQRKRKADTPAPLLTSTIETKKNYGLRKKNDPNIHGVILDNENANFDITSSSIVDTKGDEFLNIAAKEVTVTNEETKEDVINNANDAVDMCSEIVGEVEIMTSTNDDDNIPLGQLSKVINKSVPRVPTNDYAYNKSIAEKTTEKEFITKNTKKRKQKKKTANVEDDGMDNVSLSKLKNNLSDIVKENDTNVNEQHPDITTTVQETVESDVANSLNDSKVDVSAETSKRPVRRRAKKILHYEQDSDEDPFANVELSDDEPSSGKKGNRYYSDDEYIPGIENGKRPDKFSDSEAEDDLEFIKNQKKRKLNKSPKKKLIADNVSANPNELEDDIEGCIETSVIKLTEGEQSTWGTTKEFENFLANKVGSDIFIKKSKSTKSQIAPLEIPVLDLNEPKKIVEISTQTNIVSTKNSSAQTDTQNEVSMVEQVKLTAEQSKKACEFLSNIVKTTAELGQLMTQKSEDFIEKKINTTHVTDTLKMDYCVKKSFLLFKLAKHNLIQMEEDLARQYEDFLNSQNLSQHREKRKVIPAKVKDDSDSDCEIVEVIADDKEGAKKKGQKPAFNPKTVFLNKELSIKIAKKPSTPSVSADPNSAKNINIKGRHTVWINDSIMVKKVKPNQSFLAQDSRNKKPPDSQFVTLKMVNDFFESYNRQKVLSICAPFVGCNWFTSNESYFCYYSTELVTASSSNCTLIANNTPIVTIPDSSTHIKIPKPLLTLCVVVLKKLIKLNSKLATNQSDTRFPVNIHNIDGDEVSSLRNEKFTDNEVTNENLKSYNTECQINNTKVKSLSVLCLQELQKHIYSRTEVEANCSINSVNFKPDIRRYEENINNNMSQKNNSNVESLTKLCLHEFQKFYDKSSLTSKTKFISNHRHTESIDNNMSQKNNSNVESLTKLCLHEFQKYRHTESSRSESIFNCYYNSMDVVPENESYVENNSTNQVTDNDHNKSTLYQYKHYVNNLQTICHRTIVELIFENSEKKITLLEPTIINTYTLRPIDEIRNKEVKSLFSLCTRYIQNIQNLHYKQQLRVRNIPLYTPKSLSSLALKCLRNKIVPKPNSFRKRKQIVQVKTLSRLCLELISSTLYKDECSISNKKNIISEYSRSRVLPLNKLCFEKITTLMGLPYAITDFEKKSHGLSITINEINTVSEDFFNNDYNSFDEDDAYDDTGFGIESNEESHCEMENNYNDWENNENIPNASNEWAANIQMGDLRSCVDARRNNEDHATNTYQEEISSRNPLETGILSNIKQEPCEEAHYLTNIMTIIKNEPDEDVLNTEPLHGITKTEHLLHEGIENTESPLFHNGSSYDVNAFENFVSSNKLMYSLADGGSQDEEEVYGQNFPRVRRQYEPDFDSDGDNFDNLGLLIPQTVEQAKDKLMNSSSDEEGKTKKNDKRKYVKKKGKLKKPNKEIVPIKSKNADDVAVLTKKMKERLRQEDNQEDVSDEEDMPLILRKDKSKKMPNTDKVVNSGDTNNQDKLVEKEKTIDSQFKNAYEIQCNNIDSTENLETIQEKDLRRSLRKSSKLHLKNNESAKADTNDCISKNIEESEAVASSQFQKLRDQENLEPKQGNNDLDLRRSLRKTSKVHAKSETISEHKSDGSILNNNDASEDVESSHKEKSRVEESKDENPKDEESKDAESKDEESKDPENSETESYSDAVDMAEPIELLECEPTLPIFDTKAGTKQRAKAKKIQIETHDKSTSDKDKSKEIVIRNDWECYPIDHSDTKLYEYACISLEKLPESFVETYFKYINLDKEKDEDDIEIDKLTNLHTLNREKIKSKEVTRRSKTKVKTVSSDPSEGEMNIKIELEAETELSPSEDENDNTDDILPPPVQENDAENYLAKSLLMGDNDSETEDADGASQNPEESKEKRRPGPKSKTKGAEKIKVKQSPASIKKEDGADLLLTADRMMNSELALLHAPATGLTDQIIEEPKDSTKKNKHPKSKTSSKSHTTTVHIRKDDDSSSEEEKQWVTTKEKLLKRLEKKQENHIDDAKRAKIVSEFIEKRREDGPVSQSVLRRPRRGRSNRKKLLERRKQMKVLSRELCGEDASTSKRYSQSYGKGRRNIRKVIDKKSLARNTVLANIEEFERKRRLCMREAQLKETLGFEEDVNVVVINDELCLEYDFDNNQPSVTVHPFFTKVMKAHQYEGVKFMWDACFETVETVQNGGKGGGCILAHCMGLGKTLQVLALLHTVLTHPGVSMQRVLVCCPLSTVLNWVDEIHKWIGPVTNQIKVFELSKLKKTYERAYQLEDWYNGGGIFIIGYELFRSLTTLDPMLDDVRPTIINKIRMALLDPGPDIIICDEGHLLKNDMSVLAVAMSRVVTRRRIVLTGTPMQNNLREYYCMVNFIKPNLLGTYSEYSNRFENPIMNGQHRDSREEDIRLMKQRTHILHKVLEGCLQRQEASVLYPYLPKKYEYTVFISLTSCQWDLYKHYITQTKATCKGNKHGVLKDFHVLQKIWSHPQVLHHFQTRGREADEKIKAEKLEDELLRDDLTATEDIKPTPTDVWWLQYLDGGKMLDMLDSSNKFLVVFRLLDECVALGDKVLIFSTSLYALDALEYFLRVINGWSLGQDYYRLDGAVPPEVRQKWCREFNDESNTHTKLFLISTRAGCLGLNMTAANRVIILDTSWNPAHDIQSIFRVYRFGQKKDCFIYRLVALGTMEQKMYERSVTKQAVACRVVDEQQIDRHYNMAELSELYSYDEEGWSVGAGLAAGVRDAALLRVAAALQGRTGALHAVREHDSLLRDTDARLPEHERAAAWQQFQQEHAEEQPLVKIPKKFQLKVNESKERTTNILEHTAESKPARKRGRPRKYSPERSEPSTSKTMNFGNAQEVIVDKIRELLIQHKAMDATPTDITKMIGEVRKYIVDPTMDISSNPLVEKIAEVLLQQNMPPLTDCLESGSSQVTEEPETILGDSDSITRDPRQEEHKIESPSDSEATLSDTEFKDKKRKRSKIDDDYVPPQHYMYKMDDTSNISLKVKKKKEKRGRSRKNVENTPPRSAQNTRLAARNSKDVTEDTIQNIDDDNDNYTPELTGVHTIDDGINEDTIDISDDETVVAQTPASSKKKKPPKTTNELPDDILLPSKATVDSIPLPKSLLTDKKFIKIVAHMYVSSSPILDEDAATRAAEYSTSKALRELNETGENIVSGNLHEIALKVYGPEALKRLNIREAFEETKKKAADGTTESSQSSDSNKKPIILNKNKLQNKPLTQEKTTLNDVGSSNTVEIEVAPKPQQEIIQPAVAQPKKAVQPKVTPQLKPSRLKVVVPPKISNTFQFRVTSGPKATQSDVLHIPTTSHNIVPTPVTEEIVQAPVTSPQRVVPVGMFTGAGTLAVPNSMEESILPDDDDIMVIPLNSTPHPEAPTTILSTMLSKPQDMGALFSKQKDTGRRQSQQLLINSVSTSAVNTTQVNATLAHTTLANTMLTNYTPANTTLANATLSNTTLANTMLANTMLANNTLANTTITNTTLVNTTPLNTKPADTKKQASQIKLSKLAPAPPGTRTYLIKTSELEAALAKYPNGKGPTLHIDSGKVMVPVQIIKHNKQLKSTTTPTKTTNSIFIPHASAPHTKVTPNKSTAPNTPKTPIVYDSICLDSDDEDTNTNTVSGTKKPEPLKLDVRPTKNPETKQASSKADHKLTMKSEPKTPIQGSSKVDVKLSKPEKKTPDPGSVKLDKNPKSSLTDLKFKFDKYKKKNEISPTSINATAKEPEKPKKVADTKATETKSSRPGTVMFDNGASIEFVSLCENPTLTSTPTPNAKSAIGISFTNEKKTPEKPKTDTPKYKPKPKSKQTGPQINLGMIDLTSLEASEPKKSTKVIKASSSKLISGTSKDIFITNAGKLSTDKLKSPLKNVDLTGGDVTNVVNIKPSTSTKRTKKPEISTPAKKPKVEVRSKPSSALKSLMDLTFDDIDDIVELE